MSAHAAAIDTLQWIVHGLMAALFVGWGTYFLWVLIRFRQGRQPHPAAGATGRPVVAVEAAVVIAEAVLLVVFALPLWYRQTSAGPAEAGAVVVRVVAEQFSWTMHYPGADGQFGPTAAEAITAANLVGLDRQSATGRDDLLVFGELHVPVGRPVMLELSSKDVIHSFGVHALRVKQDVIPGVRSSVRFTPTATGRFEIACSQLCGLGHYRMRAVVVVDTPDAFQAFLSSEAALLKR
jgi:cytochrome c oxidase subunit 2